MTFFPSSLALDLRPFKKNRTWGYDAALRNRALGPTKNWPKTDFQWKLHTNRVFLFLVCFCFCFQDTLSLCFILFIWFIWSKNMCKHTLTHIIVKKCNFCLKNSEKPWFLVIFVFLTWRHLWRHCGVMQVMFVLFWYQWTREGHSYPLVPHTWCFVNRFPRSWGGGGIRPPPRLWDGSKKPGSFRVKMFIKFIIMQTDYFLNCFFLFFFFYQFHTDHNDIRSRYFQPYTDIASRLLKCFSLTSNLTKLLDSKQSDRSITCLNGIRVISMMWVIIGHTFIFSINIGALGECV